MYIEESKRSIIHAMKKLFFFYIFIDIAPEFIDQFASIPFYQNFDVMINLLTFSFFLSKSNKNIAKKRLQPVN